MRPTKVRVLVALGLTVLLSAPSALASGGLPKIPSYSGPYSRHDFKVKPATIDYGMGQAFFAGRHRSGAHYGPLKWTSWTSNSAEGSGRNWIDNCRPNCAAGTYHSVPVDLKAWRPRTVSGHLLFTRLTVTTLGKRPPHNSHGFQVWKLSHNGQVWFWTYPHRH